MSKHLKILALVAMIVGAIAMLPGSALAYHGHGSYHGHGHYGGHYHGGGHYYGGGWGWGSGFYFGGWGYPGYGYYASPDCGWVRVRYLRHGYWHVRRVWRCY